MKDFKIMIILTLLMGIGTVCAQQSSTDLQKSDQQNNSGLVDRTELSPDPDPGDQVTSISDCTLALPVVSEEKAAENIDPLTGKEYPSPNPAVNPEPVNKTGYIIPSGEKAMNPGPRPDDPNAKRPDTKQF